MKRRITAVRSLIALALLSAGLTAFSVAATTPATTAGKPASTKPATKPTTSCRAVWLPSATSTWFGDRRPERVPY